MRRKIKASKKSNQKKSFEERHMRMTTYIEKPLREKLELLKGDGRIKSYSKLMNKALKYYIKEKL